MVPHLTTALTGPLHELERRFLTAMPTIEHWFRAQWLEHAVPFYASVDLRNSGFKLAPVDTNLFPGGFNNLNPEFLPLCVLAMQSAVEKICPEARGVLLIPENHTRNKFYLQNVAQIELILKQAGMRVRIGSMLPEITRPTQIELPNGSALTLEPLERNGNRIGLAGFDPCVVLLNNDLSAGAPDILKNLEQPVYPPLAVGWYARRKSQHFAAYDQITGKFAQLLDIDPWLINPYFATCDQVNFQERVGEECLAAQVDTVLQKIRVKYAEYGVKNDPFVIVKADAGTYGMGIMTVKDASEVRRPEPQAAQQDGGGEGRNGGNGCADPGGSLHLRTDQRGGGRTRGVHDRPLCGRRLLSRAYHPRRGRKSQRARNAFHAARVRDSLHIAQSGPRSGRHARTGFMPTVSWRAWPCSLRRWKSRRSKIPLQTHR